MFACCHIHECVLLYQERINSPSNHPNDSDSARHAEIQELLQELRNVKDQLNISVRESQSAKEETNMIRREFSDRLRTMQESQQCLQSVICFKTTYIDMCLTGVGKILWS